MYDSMKDMAGFWSSRISILLAISVGAAYVSHVAKALIYEYPFEPITFSPTDILASCLYFAALLGYVFAVFAPLIDAGVLGASSSFANKIPYSNFYGVMVFVEAVGLSVFVAPERMASWGTSLFSSYSVWACLGMYASLLWVSQTLQQRMVFPDTRIGLICSMLFALIACFALCELSLIVLIKFSFVLNYLLSAVTTFVCIVLLTVIIAALQDRGQLMRRKQFLTGLATELIINNNAALTTFQRSLAVVLVAVISGILMAFPPGGKELIASTGDETLLVVDVFDGDRAVCIDYEGLSGTRDRSTMKVISLSSSGCTCINLDKVFEEPEEPVLE